MTSSRAPAVIYARVSSTKQVKQGDGLSSQLTRCRVYAEQLGHEVVEMFTDDISGRLKKRPGIEAMLVFLKKQKRQTFVIIDDISRLARSLDTHRALRDEIRDAGGLLISPSVSFGETSDDQLVENLLASVSQHQQQKNREQTKNRMIARMMNGYWSFRAPVGYKCIRTGPHGKMLHRDEPIASLIQEVYEGYALGRFDGMAEIMRYLKAHPAWPANKRKTLTVERVMELMSRPHYAGYLHAPEWGIIMLKGKHDPIISLETYEAVQERIKGKARTFTRYDVNESFPIRGYVNCSDCGHAYSACWSTGRSKRYPYYLCQTKNCVSYGRSVRREVLEGQFEELLRSLRPTPELFQLAQEMFRDLWNARMSSEASNTKHLQADLVKIERQIEQLVDRIIETDTASLVSAYESRVQKLEVEKAKLSEKIANCGRPVADFDATHRTAMQFLETPHKIWLSDRLCDKRNTVKLVFAEPLSYDREHGFRTANVAAPFRIFSALEEINSSESDELKMVPRRGLAPIIRNMT